MRAGTETGTRRRTRAPRRSPSTTPRRSSPGSPPFERVMPTKPRSRRQGAERMAAEFLVVVADFLEDDAVEAPILGDIARITLAGARDEPELARHVADADALILFHDIAMVGEATFSRATRCKGIVRAGVGYNNVDRAAAANHGVVVCNVPDYGTEEVADHAVLFLLA